MRMLTKSLLVVLALAASAVAMPGCQFLGPRVLKRVWINEGVGITLTPMTDWDASSSAGCLSVTTAVIPQNDPHYKEKLSQALSALATGREVNAWYCSCTSWLSTTFPQIDDFGVEE